MPNDPVDLPLERKALLLSGRDFWSTEPVEEAGLPSVLLTDGPHGVRRQQGARSRHRRPRAHQLSRQVDGTLALPTGPQVSPALREVARPREGDLLLPTIT